VLNSHGKVLLNVVPNVFPATRIIARKDYGDESLVEYIQVESLRILRITDPFASYKSVY